MNAHKKAYAEATMRRRVCADWIKTLMKPGQPKPAPKDDLYNIAKDKLGVNRANLDAAWIWVIEDMERQDWYKPIRRVARQKHELSAAEGRIP